MFKQYKLRNFSFSLVICVCLLTLIGIAVIGSAKASVQSKQILGFGLGIIAMLFVAMLDYSYIIRFSPVYYIGINGILLYVKFFGKSAGGAQRWIRLPGGIQFQPSELAKVVLILFFAWLLMGMEDNLNKPKNLGICMITAALPLFLILSQPDTSTTIVCIFILAVLLYIAGLSNKIIGSVLGVIFPLAVVGIVYLLANLDSLTKRFYQVKRIAGWLNPDEYPDYATQQVNSIMAIASGGLFGKGLNNTSAISLKNTSYIIEPQTDFIFAVAGEELGFAGAALIIVLLALIVLNCILIGIRAKDMSGKLICCGMAAWIAFQAFVNLCVATGLMPNTGVTLPFVSYGLTSLLSLYIGIGFVLNVGLQPGQRKGGLFN